MLHATQSESVQKSNQNFKVIAVSQVRETTVILYLENGIPMVSVQKHISLEV